MNGRVSLLLQPCGRSPGRAPQPVPHSNPWHLPGAPASDRPRPCGTGSWHGTSGSSPSRNHSPVQQLYMGKTRLSRSPVRQTSTDSSHSKNKAKRREEKSPTIFYLLTLQQLSDFCTSLNMCCSSATCSISVDMKL